VSNATAPDFDYKTFRSLTALVPQMKDPRPIGGMSEAGFELWTQGRMQLTNPDQYRAEADFDGNGKMDVALPFKSEKEFHLLIAERSGASWQQKALFVLGHESRVTWNGNALVLEPQVFVYWDGRQYRLEQGPVAAYAYGYSDSELSGVLLKITYGGPQEKPVPGLLLMTFQGSPNVGAFRSHRHRTFSYANDDALTFRYLTISPATMRDVLKTLLEFTSVRQRTESGNGVYSISVIDTSSPHRPNFFEVFLSQDEVASFLQKAAERSDHEDPSAAKMLRSR